MFKCLFPVAVLVFVPVVEAQTPPPVKETVVVTATLAPLPVTALARSVRILTAGEVADLGFGWPFDALRLVPGVDARARGPLGVQTDFSIRGATFGQNLVLADGMRTNNSQSAHHNGEIPLPSTAIDRIEVVAGPGSSVYGADALGGTINVISRRGQSMAAVISAGQHGYANAEATVSGGVLPDAVMVSGWGSRSSGFMFDRDFAQGGVAVRVEPNAAWTFDARHQRRAFGANGFYGPSPSKDWTDQTMASARFTQAAGAWTVASTLAGRNHADHFRWDINRPGIAENSHRTNAADYRLTLSRSLTGGASVTVGGSGGGDWITSSNLGDHTYARGAAFAELQFRLAQRTTVVAGLRVDGYSTFGRATSPAVAFTTRIASSLRVRASAGQAFRIPTFTELYYSDPNNRGTPDLRPEHGWSLDAGADWAPGRWATSLSVFRRWDDDVIDWVKVTPAEVWRSSNVRDVTATGFEASLARRFGSVDLRLHYAGLTVDAPSLTSLSKYVLEYARHQSGGTLAFPAGLGLRAVVNVDHRHRLDGQSYDLVSASLKRPFGRAEVFVEGTNVLNETYHEVVGVAMPGRWMTVGLRLR